MPVAAIVWGAITYFADFQIGWMSIGVGFLAGLAIRFFGRGKTITFGISGAILALIGCILGKLIFYAGVIAQQEGAPFLDVFFILLLTPAAAIEVFTIAFDFMDLLFSLLLTNFRIKNVPTVRRCERSWRSNLLFSTRFSG